MSAHRRFPAEAGISLVETVMAMILLGIALASLLPLTLGLAQRSLRSGMETHSLGWCAAATPIGIPMAIHSTVAQITSDRVSIVASQ